MTTIETNRTLSQESMEQLAFWSVLPMAALLLMAPLAMTWFPTETTHLLGLGLAAAAAWNVALTLSKPLARFVRSQHTSDAAEQAEAASCRFLRQMFITFLAVTVLAAIITRGQVELLSAPFWLMNASSSIIIGLTAALLPFRKQRNAK